MTSFFPPPGHPLPIQTHTRAHTTAHPLQDDPIRVGEVVVFKIKDRDIPIVHRVLKVHEKPSGRVELLTKGDNNRVDDRGLYAPGQQFIGREDILGRAVGTLRCVGPSALGCGCACLGVRWLLLPFLPLRRLFPVRECPVGA